MKYNSKHSTNVDSINWNNDLLKSAYSTSYQTAEYLTSDLENIIPILCIGENIKEKVSILKIGYEEQI